VASPAAAAVVEAALLIEATGLIETTALIETARIDTQRVRTPVESFARPAAGLPRVRGGGQA